MSFRHGGHTTMRVAKTLRPDQHGALKLSRRYGGALVCVRYRIDAKGERRYTTVELVVETAPVQRRLLPTTPVDVRVVDPCTELCNRMKAHGAYWNAATRAWTMPYSLAKQLRLTDRIVPSK